MRRPIGITTEVRRYVERLKSGLATEKPCSVTGQNSGIVNSGIVTVTLGNQSQVFVVNQGLDGEARLNIARWFVAADTEPVPDVNSSPA